MCIRDRANNDKNLLTWRAATGETAFEKTPAGDVKITEQEFFDNGLLLVAFVRAGVELAFETMVESGIKEESAYYESLHETPLIASHSSSQFSTYNFNRMETNVIGKNFNAGSDAGVDNKVIIAVNEVIRFHPVEIVGAELRRAMTDMKTISTTA